MHTRFGHTFDPLLETIPLIGSKEGLAHLALAYVQPGDATIIPDPGYNAYKGARCSPMAGVPLPITPRTKFLVELDDVPRMFSGARRFLYLNYPNNPTGAIAPMEYLERV